MYVCTGCFLVFTVSVTCSNLPHDFIRLCSTSSLSNLATDKSKHLPKSVWFSQNLSHDQLLQLFLTSIPNDIMSKCNVLPQRAKSLVYNISMLHTAIAIQHKMERYHPLSSLPCHFVNLLSCLSSLISIGADDISRIIDTLTFIANEVYSVCISCRQQHHYIDMCLRPENTVPGTLVVLGEAKFTIPPLGLSPTGYAESMTNQENSPHHIRLTINSAYYCIV